MANPDTRTGLGAVGDLSGASGNQYAGGSGHRSDQYPQSQETFYDPYANDDTRTRTNHSAGLGSMGEVLGTASSYRSPGYDVNQNAGYVGGSYGASQQGLGRYGGLAQAYDQRALPFMGDYAQGMGFARDSRSQQQTGLGMTADAAGMYRDMAMGNGPSMARLQLQQGLQQANAQQASIAAGARGGGANLAAAQLAGSTMAGQQAAAANQQAAQLRVQEQLGAMQGYGNLAGQYGGLSGQMRAADQGYAGMGQQGYMGMQGLSQGYEEMRQKQQLAELGAQTELEKQQADAALERQKQVGPQEQKTAEEGSGLLGMSLGMLSKI